MMNSYKNSSNCAGVKWIFGLKTNRSVIKERLIMCKLGIIEESVSDIAVLKELMRLLAKHRDTIYKEVCAKC